MKKIALVFSILTVIIFFSGCEKDDICIDAATPQMVIRFYDQFDSSMLKEVTSLNVQGILDDVVFPVIENVSTTEIQVPLRVDGTSTSFLITRNLTPTDSTTADIDTVVFNYDLNEQFKSRACGFVMNFENIEGTGPTINNWIKMIEVLTPSLTQNDTITNVKIFH
ncbi:DUF6452 family protein [Aurantibacter sp.]|uniref:DUF6452 family protein n=1 Tax=Aurantibacter sp. TaxID=2807103 RepID=UPI003265F146